MRLGKFCYIILFLPVSIILKAQTWQVPENKKDVTAPFRFSNETVTIGESVFMKNCQSCHGNPGKNNFANITPTPGDPATDKFQKQTDGELFYRITTGKSPMPEFRYILSEEERWDVVSFFRSFNKNYIQPATKIKTIVKGNNISLTISYITGSRQVKVNATKLIKGKQMPVKGADIILFVKRYFGNIQVDETKTSNEKGEAFFDFPADLPGNKEGFVELTARIKDNTNVNEAIATIKLPIGKPANVKSLLDTRGWWLVRGKAPIWLILTYSFSVIIVWGFILFIISQILKIRKFNHDY